MAKAAVITAQLRELLGYPPEGEYADGQSPFADDPNKFKKGISKPVTKTFNKDPDNCYHHLPPWRRPSSTTKHNQFVRDLPKVVPVTIDNV